ncbi:MAG: hypothetical protein GF400_09780 [Candidatus Eisenbacteria bacterium]|nr:hypothetical protein [Candidatus Eisenbacteria bacterium]
MGSRCRGEPRGDRGRGAEGERVHSNPPRRGVAEGAAQDMVHAPARRVVDDSASSRSVRGSESCRRRAPAPDEEGSTMKTAMTVQAMSLVLLAATAAHGTEVYWTPAHELLPQDARTSVVACDLDGDGDLDLSMSGLFSHYWNVGTPFVPEWELASESPYQGVPECLSRSGTLGDLDQDGDLDLVITCLYEEVFFYRNTGTPQVPSWQYEPSMFEGLEICPGGAEPYLKDMDADDDLDLLVTSSSTLRYMENVGTPSEPLWEDAGTIAVFDDTNDPVIALGDIDGDGDYDLVVGGGGALRLRCFENTGTPEAFEFLENPEMLIGVDVPPTGIPGIELLDIDGNGAPDLMFASEAGNRLYLNESTTPVRSTSWGAIKARFR